MSGPAEGYNCDYCGLPAELVGEREVYGREYRGEKLWRCVPCGARVGCHLGTTNPKGRLANAELRQWKIRAHAAFDPLWQGGHLRRVAAYAWLARWMEKPMEQTHIGMFDLDECRAVVEICARVEPEW